MSFGIVASPMAQGHGPLLRTNTAPVFTSRSADGLPGLGQTMSNSYSSRSSQLSGSTAFTSSSTTSLSSMTSSATLVPPAAPMPVNGGNVIATNNIINQRADASRSLYQICVLLKARLNQVPGFEPFLIDSDSDDERENVDTDPVSSLWRCLRKGMPLLAIYNSIGPEKPLQMEENIREEKRPKIAAFRFVEACLKGELQLPSEVCFSLQDLFGDDTTGFVKVTQVLNIVLDVAHQKGLLLASEEDETAAVATSGSKMSYRDHVVAELVNTERKYVQDLENLHELKKVIEQKGVIPGDVVHDIFLNINAILDFQRRFLIKIETTNSQPDDQQQWGMPFTNYEEGFGIYQPFIANQRKAAAIAKREFEKIALADHPVVVDFNTLDGFLLKPMQRLVKYPLLLKDLRDKTGADEETKLDLDAGMKASNRVLMQANAAVDKELRQEAYEDLRKRVDDWKNHRIDRFGDLLLYGHFPVVTGKSDVQKEVRPSFLPKSRKPSFVALATRIAVMDLKQAVKAKYKTLMYKDKRWPSPDPISPQTPEITAIDMVWDLQCALQYHEVFDDERHSDDYDDVDNFLNNLNFYYSGNDSARSVPFIARQFADAMGLECPQFEQYTIYLFEHILLCCKELNPNKSKDKLMGQKDKKDKKDKIKSREPNKNAKLQLKGRIFMTNVTDVLSQSKQGAQSSYTVQIFWKGDPGVENFVIRFSNEEAMKKWYEGVDGQRKQNAVNAPSGSSPDASSADFAWMRDQGATMVNPYAEADDEDNEDEADYLRARNMAQEAARDMPGIPNSTYPGAMPGMPRNASSSSLRSRSTTGESQQSLAGIARAAPPRFPIGFQTPPLSVQTSMASTLPSPGQRVGDSYFSPVAESPASSRTSTSNGMYPFPRQTTPLGGWEEQQQQNRYDPNRNTAPAMPRAPSRGSQNPMDGYQINARSAQRPSLPPQPSSAQQRSRSYSTPDINAQAGGRRLPNGSVSGQQVPAVPGIPAHLHPAYDAGIPRSANNSPNGMPMRTNTQSPGQQRERGMTQQAQYPSAPQYVRSNTSQVVNMSNVDNRTISPPLGSAMSNESEIGLPTQLKVKVNCDGNYVTLVVAFNITYQSLADRIDAKVGRFSTNAINLGTMRLRYRDEDGDYVTMESDDDIQIAFQEWRESQKQQYLQGQLGEIELFCLSVDN